MSNILIDPYLALRIVRECTTPIAYDTETTGLNRTDYPVGYVITDHHSSVYVPVAHEGGGNIPNGAEFEGQLAQAFAERSRLGYRTVGHNLAFDLRMSAKRGIWLDAPLEDTMINEALIDDIAAGYGLDACAPRYGVTAKLGADLYREIARRFGGPPDRSSMAHFWRMPGDDPLVLDYAAGDGITTLELRDAQQKRLDADDLRRVWQLECDLIPYLHRMHERGLKVDENKAEEVLAGIKTAKEQALLKLPAGFNVRSPAAVKALFDANGIKDYPRTAPTTRFPEGQASFRDKWLEKSEIGRSILDVRRLDKAVDSFITPLVTTHNVAGRVHPILNQTKGDEYGAIGGRLSCIDPNLQAFPKRNRQVGKVVRPLIIPDEGYELNEADYKQQEPRLFAHYSEDERLIEGYRSGTLDIHAIVTADFKLDRDTAKRMGMGMLTGMQPNALAGHMDWDVDTAREAHHKFLSQSFPGIGKFQELAKKVYKQRGYIKTLLGRRAHLDNPKWAYRAVSRIIQGGGADIMKTALLLANQYCESLSDAKLQMLMTIHDSNMFQNRIGADKEVAELVKIIESVAPALGVLVPIPVDLGRGTNWAEASYGK